MSPEEQLAWEERNRPKAGIAAAAAAALTVLGTIISGVSYAARPSGEGRAQTIIDTLGRAGSGLPNPPGQLAVQTEYVGHHLALPILGALVAALGTLALFPALALLFRATRARRPELPQIALVLLAVGAVSVAVGRVVAEVASDLGARGFGGADMSNSAAREAIAPPTALVGQVILITGTLALGGGILLIALNAMRAGLLTRFMGVMGMIVGGALLLTPFAPIDQQGIIRVFWLGALGALLLGRWPRGVPPAWVTGEAVPWPTQQELREERAAKTADQTRG
ncbi:MAG: hypothetical protein M3P44_07980, partial [Actinomycetota bacterium]|nr:hypothetical protein [Actinomycetota bacterium]